MTLAGFCDDPHGIAISDAIDRILVTNTIKHDLTDPGETITAVEVSTKTPLASHKLSSKASPSKVAPVEILFVPGANPPMAYITVMFGGTLWTAIWNPQSKKFDVAQAYDFNGLQPQFHRVAAKVEPFSRTLGFFVCIREYSDKNAGPVVRHILNNRPWGFVGFYGGKPLPARTRYRPLASRHTGFFEAFY